MALAKHRSILPCMLQYVRNQPQQAFAGISDKPTTLQTTEPQADAHDKHSSRGAERSEEWTEVVHEQTGQTYYWNQKTGERQHAGSSSMHSCCLAVLSHMQMQAHCQRDTDQVCFEKPPAGETTELGEPRPTTKFKDSNWQQTTSGSSGPFQEGWREPPGKDYTYFYSLIGTGIGIAVGWATQYMH